MQLLTPQVQVEERVLAEVISRPEALAMAPELEVDDFTCPWRRRVFTAIRNLQAGECPTDVLAIADEIELDDRARGTQWADTVSPLWLAQLVLRAPRYSTPEFFEAVFPADLRQLRAIADARRAVMETR